jgi:hypothetical protein
MMKSAHFIVVAAPVFRRYRGKSQRAIHATAASLASGLVPLAFLSPKIIEAIASGTARAGLTVSP